VAPEQIQAAKEHGVPVAFENDIGMRFVLIPAGAFSMGSPETEEGRTDYEGPQHEVTLAPFYMAVAQVTNAQYRRFKAGHESENAEYRRWKADHGSGAPDEVTFNGNDQPVLSVSHEDATAFVQWLSTTEGDSAYRLPSEAEWEYACRAGTTTRYWSGDTEEDLDRVGWYFRNSGSRHLPSTTKWDSGQVHGEWACRSHAVGRKAVSPWGLYDMHGNVLEWCEDSWHGSYEGAPADGSAWIDKASRLRVIRGGSWAGPSMTARSAFRAGIPPGDRAISVGFRVARAVTTE
jgi:formylglycine-generating enzyme required for sulfatase activity